MWMIGLASLTWAADSWEETLDRVTRSVVSIRMDRPIAYDGNGRSESQATGFIVDAEAGLILTNRHVVSAGPTTAAAIFLNQEEVRLEPIYRDPVHDFGLFRYDPEELRYFEPVELSLNPAGAQVGVEIRVVGNDNGEKLSILDGTIARLDRAAPKYGWGFNDFNTFYLQAASSTSGGSSGSPVVNLKGEVIGLNAGSSTRAASAFYLPLDRVKRAISLIQQGKPVTRGTLEATWEYITFDELRRRGLSEKAEEQARKDQPNGTGMLVVMSTVPLGPAHAGGVKVGDIILEVEGAHVYDFIAVEEYLDSNVGLTVELLVERDGKEVALEIDVEDLFSITPSEVLQIGNSTMHTVSYHESRLNHAPITGVYVAERGALFAEVAGNGVIVDINGEPVRGIDDAEKVLSSIPHGEDFVVRWYGRGRPAEQFVSAARMDRKWVGMRRCTLDERGHWPCVSSPEPTRERVAAKRPEVGVFPAEDKRAAAAQPKMVSVRVKIPYQVAGYYATSFVGMGLVVDAERGYVVCDRDTVPGVLADVHLRISDTFEIPARVVAVHPTNNLALVQYDPKEAPLEAFELLSDDPQVGSAVYAVDVGGDGEKAKAEKLIVERIDPVAIRAGSVPRFRAMNMETLELDTSGYSALVDKKGRLAGFHASFSYVREGKNKAYQDGIAVSAVHDLIALAEGHTDERLLSWELHHLGVAEASRRGLPAGEVEKLIAHDPERRKVLTVRRLMAGEPSILQVAQGDLLLEVEGQTVTLPSEVNALIRGKSEVNVKVFRDGKVLPFTLKATAPIGTDVDRVVMWSGLWVHDPHRSTRFAGIEANNPYISWRMSGSPAGRAAIYAVHSVISVNDVDTPDLDAFIEEVKKIKTGEYVKLKLMGANQRERIFTLRVDLDYWPTSELVRVNGEWEREVLSE